MREIILVKTGELILKGLNRSSFEDMLMKNLKHALAGLGEFSVRKNQAAIYIEPQSGDIAAMCEKAAKVFGVVAVSRAGVCEKNLDEILAFAPGYLKNDLEFVKTFKVETKRSDKKFPYKSPEISSAVGGALLGAFGHLAVDVVNPEIVVRVEVRDRDAYVYAARLEGVGGMPTGTGGKAALLLSGGIDSPVAGYMVAKRGVTLEAVHFFASPYTSELAKEKVLSLAKIVGGYTGGMRVHVVPFTKAQLAIRDNCPEEHLTLIMRRMMMAAAEKIAVQNKCQALVTGESIGQVASQTLWALAVTDNAVSMPVFRPCIGMDKEEIVRLARKIGSFETSILPYEDCCTVFTPRHPSTRPTLEKVLLSEGKIDAAALVDEAVAGTEIVCC